MIQPKLLEKLTTLPETLQTEVLHYVEFLSERYADPLDNFRENKTEQNITITEPIQSGSLLTFLNTLDDITEELPDIDQGLLPLDNVHL